MKIDVFFFVYEGLLYIYSLLKNINSTNFVNEYISVLAGLFLSNPYFATAVFLAQT